MNRIRVVIIALLWVSETPENVQAILKLASKVKGQNQYTPSWTTIWTDSDLTPSESSERVMTESLSSYTADTETTGTGIIFQTSTQAAHNMGFEPTSNNEITNDGIKETESNLDNMLYQIINETRILCPYTSYCGLEPLLKHANPRPVSCCTDCSCDSECGRRGDCCFEQFDRYRLKDKFNLSCIATKSDKSDLPIAKSYYMVANCYNETLLELIADVNISNAIYPVYSPSTNLSFYNKYYAMCNDIHDTVNWISFVTCKRSRGVFSISQKVSSGFKTGDCWLDFIPPDIMEREAFKCSVSAVDRCNVSGLAPNHSQLTEIACNTMKSLFVSHFGTYANIHCLMCNYDNNVCIPETHRTVKFALTMLINYRTVDELFDSSQETDVNQLETSACGPDYIKHPYKDECRLLKCPEGEYMVNGQCQHLSSQLYIWGDVILQMNLVPDQTLAVNDLETSQGNALVKLLRKKGFYWTNFDVFFSKDSVTNFTSVEYIMLRLVKEMGNNHFDLKKVTGKLHDAITQGWSMIIENVRYHFHVNLDRGYDRLFYVNPYYTVVRAEQNETLYLLIDTRNGLSLARGFVPNAPFFITKLFLCPRVHLESYDFIYLHKVLLLFPNKTNRILNRDEYSLIRDDFLNNDDVSLHICAEDFSPKSLLYKNTGQYCVTGNLILNAVLTLVWVHNYAK